MVFLQEKVVFGMFFLGVVFCFSFFWFFYIVYCYLEKVFWIFFKLDYLGIVFLIMGSFVFWFYYFFYCFLQLWFIYFFIVCVLGIFVIIVVQWDWFVIFKYWQIRVGVFLGFGLSGVVFIMYFIIVEGFVKVIIVGQMGWFFFMVVMYIIGVGFYVV